LALSDTLAPSAYATEPAEEEVSLELTNEQADDTSQSDAANDEEIRFIESDVIERKIAEAVERALAKFDVLKQEKLKNALPKIAGELKTADDLKKLELHHIELEKKAREKDLKAQKKVWAARQKEQLSRDAEKVKLAKNRFQLENDISGKASPARANDERIENLAVMVKELSLQVERLSKELHALREDTRDKDRDGERLEP
jgi:hypothetical protein